MKKRNILLIVLLCTMSFKTFAYEDEGFGYAGKIPSSSMERAVWPSETTSANYTGRLNNSTDGALRGTPSDLPDPGKVPTGSGLTILMLCTGAYWLNSKKNKK